MLESYRRAFLSLLALRKRKPSGLNATDVTWEACLTRVMSSVEVMSHTRTNPSPLPLRTRVSSGLKATELTHPACPLSVFNSWPEVVSHIPQAACVVTAASENMTAVRAESDGSHVWSPTGSVVV